MKYLSLLIVLPVCLLACSPKAEKTTVLQEKLLLEDNSTVLVASHRGDWRNAPENSLPAIKNAIDLGVDIVEVDLQMTADSVLILMHDATLNRTTTGKGKISELKLDSIRTFRLKNGCAIKTKEIIPTLEEALLLAKGKILINLDKADRYFDQVIDLCHQTGTTSQIIMKGSKSPSEVKSLYGNYLDEIIYMPVVNLDNDDAEENVDVFLTEMKPVAFELLYSNDDNPLPLQMSTKLEGKSLIWYNTLWDTLCGGHDDDMGLEDLDGAYGYLINTLGARIIQTDRPERLLTYLRSNKLHD